MGMFELEGQVALVTGASRGIGLAAARAMGERGAIVVLNGRTDETLQAAAEALRSDGVDARVLAFDVSSPDEACRAVDGLVAELGHIDIFFSNAGAQHREPLLSYGEEDFERILFCNLTAQWVLGRHVARTMSAANHGRIIFTGSVTALRGAPNVTAYTAAKAAIHGVVRQWAVELAPSGITVNAVAPGYVQTAFTENLWKDESFNEWLFDRVPQRRWGTPEDIAAAVVFLASKEAQFVTGQVLAVDGGMTARL